MRPLHELYTIWINKIFEPKSKMLRIYQNYDLSLSPFPKWVIELLLRWEFIHNKHIEIKGKFNPENIDEKRTIFAFYTKNVFGGRYNGGWENKIELWWFNKRYLWAKNTLNYTVGKDYLFMYQSCAMCYNKSDKRK